MDSADELSLISLTARVSKLVLKYYLDGAGGRAGPGHQGIGHPLQIRLGRLELMNHDLSGTITFSR